MKIRPRPHEIPAPSGFTLIEFLLVLALAAVVAAVAFLAFSSGGSNATVYNAVRDTNIIVANLKAAFPSQNYAGLNTTAANSAYVFPVSMNGSNYATGTLRDRWHGLVTLAPAVVGGVTQPAEFALTLNGVPGQSCATYVAQMAPVLIDATVNGTDVFANGALSPSALGAACAQPTNTVVLIGG